MLILTDRQGETQKKRQKERRKERQNEIQKSRLTDIKAQLYRQLC